MSTLSVPIDATLEEFINGMVRERKAANKADVVRKALHELREQEVLRNFYQSKKELAEGKILRGNLRDIVNKIK